MMTSPGRAGLVVVVVTQSRAREWGWGMSGVRAGELVAARELPGLLASGPVTIRVGDHGDPCGSRMIARVCVAAFAHEEPGTVGQWRLWFGGPYVYPLGLITRADARYEVTADAPEESGPCAACVRQAQRRAEEQARAVPGVSSVEELRREARSVGYGHGQDHANYVDNVSGVDIGWSVPVRFESVADDYRGAFEEGMADYREQADGPDEYL